MDTARVDIAYRPLRIAWAVHSNDPESLRHAVKLSHTLWGGRFNPIVLADRPDEARQVIEAFRADLIWPLGDSAEVHELPRRFPHLIDPLFGSLFLRHEKQPGRAHVLDMSNALVYWRDKAEWKALGERGLRRFLWDNNDPLCDVFLMRFGAYPDPDDIGIDYVDLLANATTALDVKINNGQSIPLTVLDHPSIAFLTENGLRPHYAIRPGWTYPGFFVGDATNIVDLTNFWNLRAAGVGLHFVDPNHMSRYDALIPAHTERLRASLLHRATHEQNVAVWADSKRIDEAVRLFGGAGLIACRVGDGTWEHLAVSPRMMIFGQESSLGVLGRDTETPRVSFALKDKPFSGENWFYTQHLVASLSLIGGLYDDDHHTFRPPYVPELNEFFARSMIYTYDKLRIEPDRIGVIIGATDNDAFINAVSVAELIEQVLGLAGVQAKVSSGGAITRQLISRLGGIRNTRVFKIPGVRRLLKTYGPTANFTKHAAVHLIGSKDPANPSANFSDHEDLYIERREIEKKLTPPMVFAHLVANGLFRIGAELTCPTCTLASWVPLESLKRAITCEMCGDEFDATRQLVDGTFHYRRTGVLGLERNTQGAVPVTLVLEQLMRHLRPRLSGGIYVPSQDLRPKPGVDLPVCEVDFVMIQPGMYPDNASLILGECKDGTQIDATDIENLRRIADAVPKHRFHAYILIAKLAPFTEKEVELAKTLNGPYLRRIIMMTARELEPYRLYERTTKEFGTNFHAGTAADLAAATHQIYFAAREPTPANPHPKE